MSNIQIIALYILGATGTFYLGMRVAWRYYAKERAAAVERAYNRGYKAGRSFYSRIDDHKLDMYSAVRILGEKPVKEYRPFKEAFEEKPTSRPFVK